MSDDADDEEYDKSAYRVDWGPQEHSWSHTGGNESLTDECADDELDSPLAPNVEQMSEPLTANSREIRASRIMPIGKRVSST